MIFVNFFRNLLLHYWHAWPYLTVPFPHPVYSVVTRSNGRNGSNS
jgi:hypothetical protein